MTKKDIKMVHFSLYVSGLNNLSDSNFLYVPLSNFVIFQWLEMHTYKQFPYE